MSERLPGYDVTNCRRELDEIFNEDGYNPYLSDQEWTSLILQQPRIKAEYEQLATEHYTISRYWDSAFIRDMFRADLHGCDEFIPEEMEDDPEYMKRVYERRKIHRYRQLASLLDGMEVDYLIIERKLYLNRLAREQWNDGAKERKDQFVQFIQKNTGELQQAELFCL